MVADDRSLKGSISALSYEFCSVFGEKEINDSLNIGIVVIRSVYYIELCYKRIGAVLDVFRSGGYSVYIEHPYIGVRYHTA